MCSSLSCILTGIVALHTVHTTLRANLHLCCKVGLDITYNSAASLAILGCHGPNLPQKDQKILSQRKTGDKTALLYLGTLRLR